MRMLIVSMIAAKASTVWSCCSMVSPFPLRPSVRGADPIEAYRGSLTVGRPVRFVHPSSSEWVRGLVKEIDGETVLIVPEGKARAIRLALDPDRVQVVDGVQEALL